MSTTGPTTYICFPCISVVASESQWPCPLCEGKAALVLGERKLIEESRRLSDCSPRLRPIAEFSEQIQGTYSWLNLAGWYAVTMADTNLFNQVLEWLQQQKPVYVAVKAASMRAADYVGFRVQQNWPTIYTWLMNFGRLSMMLSVLWLGCVLRGLGSLLHLGSAAHFVILWCAFVSMTAMTGLLYVLITLGIASVAVLLLGYMPAILIVAVFGSMMLWLYGSFWVTGILIITGGTLLHLNHARLAILIIAMYSINCAKVRVGWLGLAVCLNLAFISNDILTHLLKDNANEHERENFDKQANQAKDTAKNFSQEYGHTSPNDEEPRFGSSRPSGESPQTSQFVEIQAECAASGFPEPDLSSAEEVKRILHSTDHYAVLGLPRLADVDVTFVRREYRRKAMLVHPDKNMGNVLAEDAFKKLQSAYEVLLDLVKKKDYDEELRREEHTRSFQRFESGAQKNGRYDPSEYASTNSAEEVNNNLVDSIRITCKNCSKSHIWLHTNRTKARARWCQDCQDYHQAKDGDGWVERSGHSLFFEMLQELEMPYVYVCVDGKIFDASEWAICQGMNWPSNTHKPTFHVNGTVIGNDITYEENWMHRGSTYGGIATNVGFVTQEDIFLWLQNEMASDICVDYGTFDDIHTWTSSRGKSYWKKKGKRQW